MEDNNVKHSFSNHDFLLTCFNYIHQNPWKANLVTDLKNWPYSSYPDYYNYRNGTLCNKKLAMKILALTDIDFKDPLI